MAIAGCTRTPSSHPEEQNAPVAAPNQPRLPAPDPSFSGCTSIWDSVDVKANWFKAGLAPSRDLRQVPADFRKFYQKFAADSAFQRASVNDARVIAVISECDSIIRLTSKNWEYNSWNFFDDFDKENNTDYIDGWDNTFFSGDDTFYVEFIKKEIGMIYRLGFERIDGRWQLTLDFVEVC